jgi:hypothetical protein
MRISRPCYDKRWRCPGWAGGGMKYAKVERCDGGSLISKDGGPLRRCPKCGVFVLPSVIRWIDPTWLVWWIPYRIRDWNYNRKWR